MDVIVKGGIGIPPEGPLLKGENGCKAAIVSGGIVLPNGFCWFVLLLSMDSQKGV